jgi:hypothetical protein
LPDVNQVSLHRCYRDRLMALFSQACRAMWQELQEHGDAANASLKRQAADLLGAVR